MYSEQTVLSCLGFFHGGDEVIWWHYKLLFLFSQITLLSRQAGHLWGIQNFFPVHFTSSLKKMQSGKFVLTYNKRTCHPKQPLLELSEACFLPFYFCLYLHRTKNTIVLIIETAGWLTSENEVKDLMDLTWTYSTSKTGSSNLIFHKFLWIHSLPW